MSHWIILQMSTRQVGRRFDPWLTDQVVKSKNLNAHDPISKKLKGEVKR